MTTYNIGSHIDQLYAIRAERLAKEKEIEELKVHEKLLDDELKEKLLASGLNGAKGNLASFSIKLEIQPNVLSWEDMYKYIQTTGEFDLLHKRIGATAWRERYESGVIVPGTESVETFKTSLRKI